MKTNDFSNAEHGRLYRENAELEKLRAEVGAGWQQVEEGKVKDFDLEAVKRRGREKLARLRNANPEAAGDSELSTNRGEQ